MILKYFLFLLALCNAAEIDAHPLLLSTRQNGKINVRYPFEKDFNYVVVMAGNENPLLVDATNRFLPFYKIPVRCINENGLIVEKKKTNWVELKDDNISSQKNQITIHPNPETLKAATSISSVYSDYEAAKLKDKYSDDNASIKDFFLSKGFSRIDGIRTRNYDQPEKSYQIFIEGEMNIEKIGNKIVISPFLALAMNKNKLRQKERNYPVDLIFAREESFEVTIHIPEGYKVEHLPENIDVSDDLADIQIIYESKDEKQVYISGKNLLKKAVYAPDEYSKIKSHFNTIVKRFNEDVVLKEVL